MNANAILDKIRTDAQENASAILADANDRAARMHRATEEKLAAAREKTVRNAEEDAVGARARMERMAELEERKLLLRDKRAMIDRAFQKALERLLAMPSGKARAFLVETVAQSAAGDETVIAGADHAEWLDASFVDECNAALRKAGREGCLTLAKERRPGVSGLVLAKNNIEINCTWEALLSSQRMALEAEVAAVLFPEA